MGPERHAVGALDSAAEPATGRLHRGKAPLSSLAKNLAKSRGPEDILAAQGFDSADPNDVMRWVETNFGHPCDLGGVGLPEEIASATTYLASRRNGYVTGATVNVDGGTDFL